MPYGNYHYFQKNPPKYLYILHPSGVIMNKHVILHKDNEVYKKGDSESTENDRHYTLRKEVQASTCDKFTRYNYCPDVILLQSHRHSGTFPKMLYVCL